jgi:RNA polymerase primary sigma factor
MQKKKSTAYDVNEGSLSKYFVEIGNIPLLSMEEEIDLAQRIRKGDRKALAILIQSNLRFVVRIAYEYRNQGLPLGDLINEGNLGLIKAAHKFDETKGFKFISYAVWWIRQSIMQAIADHARVVRLPINRLSTLNRVGKTIDELEKLFERPPTMEEVAGLLDMTSAEISSIMQYPGKHVSLDAPPIAGHPHTLIDVTENPNMSPPDHPLNMESMKVEISKALESLTQKESDILQMYFGLNGERALTLDEIGKRYRITRERVRQIKERALIRLRHQSRSKTLRQYLG